MLHQSLNLRRYCNIRLNCGVKPVQNTVEKALGSTFLSIIVGIMSDFELTLNHDNAKYSQAVHIIIITKKGQLKHEIVMLRVIPLIK